MPTAPLLDCLIENPVELVDGHYQLRLPDRNLPLRMGRQPVSSFAQGWFPRKLFLGFAPLLVLEFQHEGGAYGVWLLDSNLERVGGSVEELSPNLRDLLIQRAMPVMREILAVLDVHGSFRPGLAAVAFLQLHDHFKHQVGNLVWEQLLPRPQSYLLSDFASGQTPIVFPTESSCGYALSETALAAGFEPEWQEKLLGAATTGTLTWASPIDGRTLACRGTVLLDDFHFAFRFVDETYDLVFYVLVAEHRSHVAGVWFPSLGIMISLDEFQRGLGHILRWHLPARIVAHVLSWAWELDTYFSSEPTGLSNVLRGNPGVHIGHQLWNELTGINELVDKVSNPEMSHLVVGGQRGLEIYGPIDEIFPSLAGKVVRSLLSLHEMTANAYASGDVVCRVTREYVSTRLRDKLLTYACKRQKQTSFPDGPVLLFGLRVENRTLVDLDGFLHRFMSMVEERYPDVAVVFDGHNCTDESGNGDAISSHGESLARIPPHVFERNLVERLRASFPRRRHLIYDTIMQPVSCSIAWAHASAGFVSIWGASLAKYRWVANLPGFVISSAHNLQYRRDLHIYDSPKYMEAPAAIEFVDHTLVFDDPSAERLVPVGSGELSFANFRLNESEVLVAIDHFIAGLIRKK